MLNQIAIKIFQHLHTCYDPHAQKKRFFYSSQNDVNMHHSFKQFLRVYEQSIVDLTLVFDKTAQKESFELLIHNCTG